MAALCSHHHTLTEYQFVPSSHLWGHSRRPRGEEAVAAEMEVGEAFMFLGSTVHGGGSNVTHESRPMHSFFYCRSWMRPEVSEKQALVKDDQGLTEV